MDDARQQEAGFSGTKAAGIVGISYRQLDYWARTDLVRPSLCDASGSGSRRRYSYRDLLELRVQGAMPRITPTGSRTAMARQPLTR